MDAQSEIVKLREEIRHHNDLYYNQDNPEITDYAYDQLMLRLRALEEQYPEYDAPDSPSKVVGGSAKREVGVLVRHDVPMMGLQDVFS